MATPNNPSQINPGPVVTPASNPHRVGAPNHLEGSGETPMVGTNTTPGMPRWFAALLADNAPLAGLSGQGKVAFGWPALCAALLDEITTLQAEADAADDAVLELLAERDALAEDLAWELNAARTAAARAGGGEA